MQGKIKYYYEGRLGNLPPPQKVIFFEIVGQIAPIMEALSKVLKMKNI